MTSRKRSSSKNSSPVDRHHRQSLAIPKGALSSSLRDTLSPSTSAANLQISRKRSATLDIDAGLAKRARSSNRVSSGSITEPETTGSKQAAISNGEYDWAPDSDGKSEDDLDCAKMLAELRLSRKEASFYTRLLPWLSELYATSV
ncbi:hypothetical protein GJ744_005003 [Endocarpon pusillum]|uniref:Uncharacterized protein n=1 Tax=Endocarpon pusillum TaxID=364733 RepID=A0A8H7A5A3_9EURO|nr:hypothetical protein GJ744_005003 [Endocarpon pusillum]